MDCGSINFCVATQNADAMVWNGSNWSTPVQLYPQQLLADINGIGCTLNGSSCVGILQIYNGQGGVSGDLGLTYGAAKSQ
jgi:hypothetical protein